MIRYVARRLSFIVVTILAASIIIFSVTQLLPGDVAQMILGRYATEEAVQHLREQLGLNQPAYLQYVHWLGDFVTGDWGTSLLSGSPVRPLVMERLANSAMIAGLALLLYVPLGLVLGVIAALRRDTAADHLISSFSMTFVGLPEFVTGLVFIAFFSHWLGILPANSSISPHTGFFAALPQLILPALAVSLTGLGYIARMTRSSTIKVLQADYTRAADLKGLSRSQVLVKHVLRNSLLPTVTIIAMGIGWLIGGLIVTESVFGYPGLGRLVVYGIKRQDLPIIQASTMVIIVIYSLSNLAADIIYAFLNPRIRLG